VLLYIKEYTLDLSASVLRGTMVSVSKHNSVKPESSRQKLGCSAIEAQGAYYPLSLSLPPDFHQTAITVLLDLQSTQKK
jgi:hypothetical protein